MAAGADVTQPVGALEKPVTSRLDVQLPPPSSTDKEQNGFNPKPPRPGPVFIATTTITRLTSTTTTTTNTATATSGNSTTAGSVRKCVSTVSLMSEVVEKSTPSEKKDPAEYVPVIRSGGCADIGTREFMEDEHVRVDDLGDMFPQKEGPHAFYGVFDGHGGKDAAQFVRKHLLSNIVTDANFPSRIEDAVRQGFHETDNAFAEACLIDEHLDFSSGTTALTALVIGRSLLVANVGDCRAVLSRKGKAVEMSRDHKPVLEKTRIEAVGGFVDDGYLNGQLNVARALGDWHMKELKIGGPLISEPELRCATLTEDDEFLIIGCDGLWDVFTSQNAIDMARKELQCHNDPELCSKQLVAEALRRNTTDNLTVVTVCFRAECPPRLSVESRIRRSFSAEGLRNVQDFLNRC